MEYLKTELKHLGLSEKESNVYLAALELGPSSVQDISHKSRVNRATTYVMIESLSARGLMSTFVKGKKRFYSAENPDRLMSIIQVQQRELKEKQSDLEKTLPMLMALYNAEGAKPQIRYLEGPEGLRTVRDTFEKLDGDWIEIVPVEDVHATEDFLGEGRKRHHASLHKQQASYRILAVMDKPDMKELSHEIGVGEFRIIPSSQFPIHGSISVRKDHVVLFSYRSAILSVVIVSKEIADVVRALFDLAWSAAQQYPSKKSE